MSQINISMELRPCLVRKKDGIYTKAFFHLWVQRLNWPLGIVEYETGDIELVQPEMIRFLDTNFDLYYWGGHQDDCK